MSFMRMWKGVKKRDSASHSRLQLLSSFLLAATLGREIINAQTPGRLISISLFSTCQNIQELYRK